MKINEDLFDFIEASPTAFHAVEESAKRLNNAGYTSLNESDDWHLERGKGYYVTRNLSSLIAFRVPKTDFNGFMIAAAHGDSPSFKFKEKEDIDGKSYIRLSVEPYGGMIMYSWMDRPLSVAGRAVVRTEDGVKSVLVNLKEPVCIIPSLAIHMNKKVNEGYKFNPAVDMLPLFAMNGHKSLRETVAENIGVCVDDIISEDLTLFASEKGIEWGDFISCPRLDDLQCAFSALSAFISSEEKISMPVFTLFDNEEVGSNTKQGAASTFLADILKRICAEFGSENKYNQIIANSFMASCDNAHSLHPNHEEISDPNHRPVMNGGVVIKYNAEQKYTSDAVSAGIFRLICEKAGVPVQYFANRADLPGGSTLGNISNTQVSMNAVDIGLAQLAMHSAFETAGAYDTEKMIKALKNFYSSSIIAQKDGEYKII